jgi:tetratricopeptide (TPR) repeat protein
MKTKFTKTYIKRAFILLMVIYALNLINLRAAFEDIEIGAKAASMAGAFVAQSDDLTCLFYNPAGLVRLERPQIYASYEKKYWGLTDNSNIGEQIAAFGMPFNFGNFGVAWHMLSLANLYSESIIKFGYARKIKKSLYGGLSVSSLQVKYGETEYTKLNPVFANGYSKSALSVDVGIIYSGYLLDVGISALNINSPDIGLKHENKVPMKINTGVTLKQGILNVNLAGVIIEDSYRFKTGIETWLYKRNVSLRGGLNVGTPKYRNAALGLGYKDSRYEIDYAFTYPLSGIANIYGSHQVSFIYRFGEEKKEKKELEFTWKDLIKLARGDMAIEKDEAKKEQKKVKKKNIKVDVITPNIIASAQELLIAAKEDFKKGQYIEGHQKAVEAKNLLPDDKEINEWLKKGTIIAGVGTHAKSRDKKDVLIRKAVDAYMKGNSKTSINSIRYARQLYKGSQDVTKLVSIIEKEFSELAESENLLPGINLVDQKLQQALELIYGQKYVAAVSVCMEVTELEPKNILALMRMGSAYWAMGHTNKAKNVWKKALKYDPNNAQLMEFLKMKKPGGKSTVKKKPQPKKADDRMVKEYENGINYYKRVKKYGAGNDTLKSILLRMIDKFKDSGIDISFLYQELNKYK